MARFTALLILALMANAAFAGNGFTSLKGDFITISGETGKIDFNTSRDSENASFVTSEKTICFNGLLFLSNICIVKEVARIGNRVKASLKVTNAEKIENAKITCGENSSVSLVNEIDFWDLRGCTLTYEIPAIMNTYFGAVMINGSVSAKFSSDTVALRYVGDIGTCKSNDTERCQQGWLFENNSALTTVNHGTQIIGIFKVGKSRR